MQRSPLKVVLMVVILSPASFAENPSTGVGTTTASSAERGAKRHPAEPVHQLLTLLDELERDGKEVEAARVRAEAREWVIKEQLIERKAAELESLQEELDRLRKLTDESLQVKVRLLAIAVDRTRLGELTEEFDRLTKDPSAVRDLRDLRRDSPLFNELTRRRVIDFLASPTLITTSGQAARLQMGGEVDIPLPGKRADGTRDTRKEFVGIQAEVLPAVRAGGQIHLKVKLRKSELQTVVPDDDGAPIPIVDVTSTDNDVTLEPRQTIILGGMRRIHESEQVPSSIARAISQVVQLVNAEKGVEEPRKLDAAPLLKKTEDVETLFLVSAELIDPPPAARPVKSAP